jgi:hypothetical protein
MDGIQRKGMMLGVNLLINVLNTIVYCRKKKNIGAQQIFMQGPAIPPRKRLMTPCPKAMKLLYYYVKETAPERGC